ncbi:mandelate racemase/muconate lactonizing enzyme family protein [Spongiactinospora sp. TRM90649]|uniref:mandelate racemase/muconate lactonizing enzyme family protein n=1 Tax=Spongiactinospora sp. TRM90649 TaxID=3031114 RepID=UPI0023F6213C|nr:mandelate racemase/muconate lactonizing enzyme family protein [Spongiactinospora sp. TRM90649]MDF5755605.1 mandelate racemase/muconate lactonizing enzyme family protein [Spongiactinospora sp. TRM90649]
MKITDVRARVVELRYPRPFRPSWAPEGPHPAMSAVIVEVETDEGLVGVSGGDMGHGTGPMLLEAVRGWIRPQLLGLDPFDTTHIANRLRYVAEYVFPRPWVVGVAVWDVVGKACGQPLYKLWGGHSGAVRAYASFGEVRDAARRADDAQRVAEEGFQGVKLRVHADTIAEDVAQVAAVREAVGPDMAIMVDANQAAARWRYRPDGTRMLWDYERALTTARELADLGVAWLEEPLPRHDYRALCELTRASPIPIAGGEHNRGIGQLVRLLEDDCFDIYQPDANESEEIGALRDFGAVAAAKQRRVIPHAWATGLGVAGNLQLCASLPNCDWLEYPYDPPVIVPEVFHAMLTTPLVPDSSGLVRLPDGPGLGVELDHAAIEPITIAQV